MSIVKESAASLRKRGKHCSDNIFFTPDGVSIVRDPHHGGLAKWMYWDNSYWHNSGDVKRWVRVKKVSLTSARIMALASITPSIQD